MIEGRLLIDLTRTEYAQQASAVEPIALAEDGFEVEVRVRRDQPCSREARDILRDQAHRVSVSFSAPDPGTLSAWQAALGAFPQPEPPRHGWLGKTEVPSIALVRGLAEVWDPGSWFMPTRDLIDALIRAHPDVWGEGGRWGKALTAQRLGRILASDYRVNSCRRPDGDRARGYHIADLVQVWISLGLGCPSLTDQHTDMEEDQ